MTNNAYKLKVIRLLIIPLLISRIFLDYYSIMGIEYNTYNFEVFIYDGFRGFLSAKQIMIITIVSITLTYGSMILFWLDYTFALLISSFVIVLNFVLNALSGIYIGMPIEMSSFYLFWLIYIAIFSISMYEYIQKREPAHVKAGSI